MQEETKKCKVCGKAKPVVEFDWLRNQDKYHNTCTHCTKNIVLADRFMVTGRGRPKKI